MSTPARKGRPAELTHVWVALRDAHGSQPVDFVLAGLADASNRTRLSVISGSAVNSDGARSRMLAELDALMLEDLATGFYPVAEAAGSELETLARHLGSNAPGAWTVCHHLHTLAAPWGAPATGVELKRLAADTTNTMIFLRPRGERALIVFAPGHGASTIMYAGQTDGLGERRSLAVYEDLSAAQLPPMVLDVVFAHGAPVLMVDVLSYDNADVRRRPFAERRALINQIWAEMVGANAHQRCTPLVEALPEQTELRATALINRRAPFGAWRHGR